MEHSRVLPMRSMSRSHRCPSRYSSWKMSLAGNSFIVCPGLPALRLWAKSSCRAPLPFCNRSARARPRRAAWWSSRNQSQAKAPSLQCLRQILLRPAAVRQKPLRRAPEAARTRIHLRKLIPPKQSSWRDGSSPLYAAVFLQRCSSAALQTGHLRASLVKQRAAETPLRSLPLESLQ